MAILQDLVFDSFLLLCMVDRIGMLVLRTAASIVFSFFSLCSHPLHYNLILLTGAP